MFRTRRTDAVLLLVAAVWGSSYLAAKTATHALPVLVVLFARYLLSAVVCLALVAARRERGRGRGWGLRRRRGRVRGRGLYSRDEIRIGALLGGTQAAVLVTETYGVAHTSAANAGLIISLTIVLTPLLDRAPGGDRLPPRFFAAALVCLLAVGVLMSGSGFHALRTGDLLMLAAAVLRAAHVALVGRLTDGRAVRPLQLTTVQTVVGAALFVGPAVGGLPALGRAGGPVWAQLVYLALFCSVFAFLAQTWAVQRGSASRASLLLGTEPVWAVAVGIGLGGERFTVLAALGAALMVAGTYWGQAIESRSRSSSRSRRQGAGAAGAAARPLASALYVPGEQS
ncbi:DMT family transporter [Kitasatospora sp. NBC_01287]|uniref:DMT family transporter n=1 Tax=Kitasatospora sp. NBC_01287 TaxID=2903573 RepID=UPI002258C4EE|nr:DMT family transporter [Kitasatospora sp. NBC_01287]MCX4749070.1 DMT family transporter [Kitasatospora sp. NBC_01287]